MKPKIDDDSVVPGGLFTPPPDVRPRPKKAKKKKKARKGRKAK